MSRKQVLFWLAVVAVLLGAERPVCRRRLWCRMRPVVRRQLRTGVRRYVLWRLLYSDRARARVDHGDAQGQGHPVCCGNPRVQGDRVPLRRRDQRHPARVHGDGAGDPHADRDVRGAGSHQSPRDRAVPGVRSHLPGRRAHLHGRGADLDAAGREVHRDGAAHGDAAGLAAGGPLHPGQRDADGLRGPRPLGTGEDLRL